MTALLLSYICIASISAAIITPALPLIQQSFHLGHGAVEWLISLFLMGYVIGQLIYSPLANRYGRLFALRTGLRINLLGIVLCLWAVQVQSYSLLLFGRLVTALGASAGLTCTFMLINELLSPAQAKRAMSYAIVSFTLGIGIAVSVGGFLTEHVHWAYTFVVLLIHGIMMLSASHLFKETLTEPSPLTVKTIAQQYLGALASPALVANSFSVAFSAVVSYCYAAAAPMYAQTMLHLSPSAYGSWNLINVIGMLGSGLSSAWMITRWGAERVLWLGLIAFVPCLGSLWLLCHSSNPTPLWFFSTTLALYYFSSLVFPVASYYATNAIADRASASSMMSFINMGSAMSSVILMGYLPGGSLESFTMMLTFYFLWVLCLNMGRRILILSEVEEA